MCSTLAAFIRTMLSLAVALTLLFGLVGAPAAFGAPVVAETGCATDAADTVHDANCMTDRADGSDEDRAQEPILVETAALPHVLGLPRPLAPPTEIRDPHRFASEHDRPPRLDPASPRGEPVRRT